MRTFCACGGLLWVERCGEFGSYEQPPCISEVRNFWTVSLERRLPAGIDMEPILADAAGMAPLEGNGVIPFRRSAYKKLCFLVD